MIEAIIMSLALTTLAFWNWRLNTEVDTHRGVCNMKLRSLEERMADLEGKQ